MRISRWWDFPVIFEAIGFTIIALMCIIWGFGRDKAQDI